MSMTNDQLGEMIVLLSMKIDKMSVKEAEKEALTYTQKMMKRVNTEIQSGLKRGFVTAIGSIFGGEQGMLVGAMMGAGSGAALGVAVGYAIDYAVKTLKQRYNSEDFFKSIDPYVKSDYQKITDVKNNINVDTKDALILSELAKIFKTDPTRLSKQIAISQQYKGFEGLEGGTSAEKMFNFLGSISGLSPADQIKLAKRYGITASNIPSLKEGMGNIGNTLLSSFNNEDFTKYSNYLDSYSDKVKDFRRYEKEMGIKARKGLDANDLSVYDKQFTKSGKLIQKGVDRGLEQQTPLLEALSKELKDIGKDFLNELREVMRENDGYTDKYTITKEGKR